MVAENAVTDGRTDGQTDKPSIAAHARRGLTTRSRVQRAPERNSEGVYTREPLLRVVIVATHLDPKCFYEEDEARGLLLRWFTCLQRWRETSTTIHKQPKAH